MTERKYLPTLAELIDRLTIVQLKMIFIPEYKAQYLEERAQIEHDITLLLSDKAIRTGLEVRAVIMLMLTNRFIWENEAKARLGGSEQDKLLKLTHSINGVRTTAKNILSESLGDRQDFKIDCFAAELEREFGNWNIW